ncbi:MAG: class I SAM-dependent methyltransferase [Blastocatellia bacterium]
MSRIYEPDLYDILTPNSIGGDMEWYRHKAVESGGPVLELGGGTGRVAIPIAHAGVTIYVLDSDAGMLEALDRKIAALPAEAQQRIIPVAGDMRSFALDRQFALITAPFRAFLHNLTTEDQLACLRTVHKHLRPGGRIAFNVFHPSLEYMAQNTGALAGVWRVTASHPLPDGGQLLRSESNRYDTVRQRVFSLHRYERYGADGNLERTFLQRLELAYLYPADIRRLLTDSGFDRIEIAGGFDGRPLMNDRDELAVEAVRV